MSVEERLKHTIGDLVFQLCALQAQLAAAQKRIAELEPAKDDGAA